MKNLTNWRNLSRAKVIPSIGESEAFYYNPTGEITIIRKDDLENKLPLKTHSHITWMKQNLLL